MPGGDPGALQSPEGLWLPTGAQLLPEGRGDGKQQEDHARVRAWECLQETLLQNKPVFDNDMKMKHFTVDTKYCLSLMVEQLFLLRRN